MFQLNYDHREVEAATQVIKSQWITMGEQTHGFELAFSQYLGDNVSSVALSSGTAALHVALLALGVGKGDEVIIPALTFVADINTVKTVGATPVLADCDSYDHWNMSARTIAPRITNDTKAVICMHYAGYPCQIEEIAALCQAHGMALIEDAAHAPGARYQGKSCGTYGDIGCFSFFSNKNLSIGEGGMLVTSSSQLEKKARYYRSHGMTSLTLDRHQGRSISYDVVQPGLNYRMDEIRAAIGLVQLEKLAAGNTKRRRLTDRYRQNLKGYAGASIPFQWLVNSEPSCHIQPVLLNENANRGKVMEHLKSRGVQSSIHYPYIQDFTAFKHDGLRPTPIARDIAERELTLPLFPDMTFDQVDYVVEHLKEAMG